MKKYGKQKSDVVSDVLMSDIDLAVDEGLRRFVKRVLKTYDESGSYSRAARHLLMDEAEVRLIVETERGESK